MATRLDVCIGCGLTGCELEEPMATVRNNWQGWVLCRDCGDDLLDWWDEGGDFEDERYVRALKVRRAPIIDSPDWVIDFADSTAEYERNRGRHISPYWLIESADSSLE